MLRDQLLRDVENLNSAEGAAVWARRILPAKNTLHEADARQVEEAFEARLTELTPSTPAQPSGSTSAIGGEGDDAMQGKARLMAKCWLRGSSALQVMCSRRPSIRANLPIPSRGAFGTRIISDLSRPSRALSAAAHLPIPIICALRKAAHLDERSATSGSSHSVEAIIARFIATVTNATGGEKPALIRTLPHEVCGYNLIPRVRSDFG